MGRFLCEGWLSQGLLMHVPCSHCRQTKVCLLLLPPREPGSVLHRHEMLLTSHTVSLVPIVQAGKAVEPVTDFLPGSSHDIRSILVIQNAELEDSGTYVCNVSEGYHEKTDRKDITVQVIGASLTVLSKAATHMGVAPEWQTPLSVQPSAPSPSHPCPH